MAQAGDWLTQAAGPSVVLDLGAGTGATLRAFAASTDDDPTQETELDWHLVDNDQALLAEARRRHSGEYRLQTHALDLRDVGRLPIAEARLITASALLDLVSADFIDTLVAQMAGKPVGLYAALNYNGISRWEPTHELDESVLAAFNRDQSRDKGFGPALGPAAGEYLERACTAAGLTVVRGDSPWLLDGQDATLLGELIEGIGAAVLSDADLEKSALEDWADFRKAHVEDGSCIVGHMDLLALPGD